MAVTYNLPLTPPIINSYSIIPGNLPAGNWKFFIFSRGYSATIFDSPMWHSPWVEVNITLSSPGGVRFDCSATDSNHQVYAVFGQLGTGRNQFYRPANSSGFLTDIFDIDNNSLWYNSTAFIQKAVNMPFGLRKDEGIGRILIDGANGNITPNTIISALDAAGETNYFYDGSSTLKMLASIDSRTAKSGVLNLSYWTLWTYGGMFNNRSGLNLYCKHTTINPTKKTALHFPASMGAARYFYAGLCDLNDMEISIDATNLTAGTNNVWGNQQFVLDNNSKITNSFIISTYPSLRTIDSFSNCKIFCTEFLCTTNISNIINPLELIECGRIRNINNSNFISRGWKIYSSAIIDLRISATTPIRTRRYIDSEWYGSNTIDGYPPVLFAVYTGEQRHGKVYFASSFNCKVQDEEGNSIEGVNVKIENIASSQSFEGQTDSDGKNLEQIFDFLEIEHDYNFSGGSSNNIRTWYKDFNLTISKDGYESYTAIVDMSKKIDLNITLKTQVPLIVTPDDVYVKKNPENIWDNRDLAV